MPPQPTRSSATPPGSIAVVVSAPDPAPDAEHVAEDDAEVATEPAPSADPFTLLETPEARAARLRLEELAAGKVIADALQVGLADPQPPAAPQRSLRGKRPTGPLPAERSRLDPPPAEPAQVVDSSQAETALLEADQARAKAEMIANELREVVEAERALRAEAARRAEELGAQISIVQAEREAAEQRVNELEDEAAQHQVDQSRTDMAETELVAREQAELAEAARVALDSAENRARELAHQLAASEGEHTNSRAK